MSSELSPSQSSAGMFDSPCISGYIRQAYQAKAPSMPGRNFKADTAEPEIEKKALQSE